MSRQARLTIASLAAAVASAAWCPSGIAFPAAEGFGRAAMDAEARSSMPTRASAPRLTVKPSTNELAVLFFAATGADHDWIAGQLGKKKVTQVEGLPVTMGILAGKWVAVVETGIGKGEAVPSAKGVLGKLKPRAVISTGVAGALSSEVSPGDVVISGSCGFHSQTSTPTYTQADRALTARGVALANEIAQDSQGRKVVVGRVTSGDEAVTSEQAALKIRAARQSVAADTDAAYLAQVCSGRKIPFLAIRGISHRAGKNAATEFARYGDSAAEASARVAAALIQ